MSRAPLLALACALLLGAGGLLAQPAHHTPGHHAPRPAPAFRPAGPAFVPAPSRPAFPSFTPARPGGVVPSFRGPAFTPAFGGGTLSGALAAPGDAGPVSARSARGISHRARPAVLPAGTATVFLGVGGALPSRGERSATADLERPAGAGLEARRGTDLPAGAQAALAGLSSPTDKVALTRGLGLPSGLSRYNARWLARESARWSPLGQTAANKLLAGVPLSAGEVSFFRGRLRALPSGPAFANTRDALGAALRAANFNQARDRAYRALMPLTGGTVVYGWTAPDGWGLSVPAGPLFLDGPALDLSIVPGPDDPGAPFPEEDDPGAPPPVPWDARPTPEEGPPPVPQVARALRLSNATKDRVTFFVRYETRTEGGKVGWFPEKGTALRVEVAPGQSGGLVDAGWPVAGSRARVWAEGGGRKWEQFKEKDLPLVPERDGDGAGYRAVVPQALVVTVR